MKLLHSLAAIILSVPTAVLGAPAWSVVPAESNIKFQTTQAGGIIAGSFGHFDATIVFDPADLATSHVEISIDVASVTTGAAERDVELVKPDWFDVSRFPRATFVADRFQALGNNNYVAGGTLALRDASVPISLPFKLDFHDGGVAVMQGAIDLDRTTFGVGQGQWATSDIVGHKVTVIVRISARRSG